jgi:hypothetical protein
LENTEEHSRKVSWNVKWHGKYGRQLWNDMKKNRRKAFWIVKWFGNYRRELWNGMENMEERQTK